MTDDLLPATPAEITSSIRYSLRFGATGKAHGKRTLASPELLASWVTEHLLMSGFVVLRRPPRPIYNPGNCGAPPRGADDA